jgi:hypothetical protein
MKERAQELKAEARRGRGADKADGERAVLAKIAEMQGPDRAMAERLHPIIKASAQVLSPKTWYGMSAYAKDGKVVCFFQSAQKFNARYATLRIELATGRVPCCVISDASRRSSHDRTIGHHPPARR